MTKSGRLACAIIATTLVAGLACAIKSNTALADETINYGVQPDTDPSFIAEALGLFKPIEQKHHVKIVFRRFSYGAPENQAMGAGALQVARDVRNAVIVTIFPDSADKYMSERFWNV